MFSFQQFLKEEETTAGVAHYGKGPMQGFIDGDKHHFLTEQIDIFRPPRDKGVR